MTTPVTLTPNQKDELLDVCIDRANFNAVAQADDRSWTLFEKTVNCTTFQNRLIVSFIGVIPPCTAIYANCYIQRPVADATTVPVWITSVDRRKQLSQEPVAVVVASLAANRLTVETSEVWREAGYVCAAMFSRLRFHQPDFPAIQLLGVIDDDLMTLFAQSGMNYHWWSQDGDMFRRKPR